MPDPRNIFKSRYKKQTRTYSYGKVPGIEVGTILKSRKECSDLGLHGPTQAGIHGNAVHGAYSVVLSGGYEDDEDNGESFWYTGEGGRKDGGGPQVEDQSWKNKNNKSLKNSCGLDKQLIRVIRGHTLQSPYAPSHGYRYDGLYRVTQAKQVRGKSGYLLCKFFFQRKPNQPPLPEPTSITRSEKLKQNIPSHYSASSSDSEDEAPTMVIESTSKRTDTPDSQSTRVHTPLASTSKTRIPETEFIEVEDSADDDNLFSGADSEKESEQEEQEASDEVPSSSHQPPSPSLVALGKRKRFLTPISISSDEEDFPLKPPKRKKAQGVVASSSLGPSSDVESVDLISQFSDDEGGKARSRSPRATRKPSTSSRRSLPMSLVSVTRAKVTSPHSEEIAPPEMGSRARLSPPNTRQSNSPAPHLTPAIPAQVPVAASRPKPLLSILQKPIPSEPTSPEGELADTISRAYLPVPKSLPKSRPNPAGIHPAPSSTSSSTPVAPVQRQPESPRSTGRIADLTNTAQSHQPEPQRPPAINPAPSTFVSPSIPAASVQRQSKPMRSIDFSSGSSSTEHQPELAPFNSMSVSIPASGPGPVQQQPKSMQSITGGFSVPALTGAKQRRQPEPDRIQVQVEHRVQVQTQPEVPAKFDWNALLQDLTRINAEEFGEM